MVKQKNKKFTQREVDIYSLGFRDGEAQLQKTINIIKKTHRHLYDELFRLDLIEPILADPDHVRITIKLKQLRKMATILEKAKSGYARLLRKHIQKHEADQAEFTANLEQELTSE